MVTFQILKRYQWKIKIIKKKIPVVTFKFFKHYQRKLQKKKIPLVTFQVSKRYQRKFPLVTFNVFNENYQKKKTISIGNVSGFQTLPTEISIGNV
jgi:hypothetical protein